MENTKVKIKSHKYCGVDFNTNHNVGKREGGFWLANRIHLAEAAIDFLIEVYGKEAVNGGNVYFYTGNRARYYHGSRICKVPYYSSVWHTYVRKTVGLATPRTGIYVGQELELTIAVIHEMTHYIQHKQKRKFSEVETTQNEIDFIRQNYPEHYNKLISI